MTIAQKITLSLAFVLLLILTSSAAGGYGSQKLGEILDYLTGPAWDTADGAMEGTIGIQQQMLGVGIILRTPNADEGLRQIAEAREFGGEALQRMEGSGTLPESNLTRFRSVRRDYEQVQQDLLAQHRRFQDAHERLVSNFADFQGLLSELNQVGDAELEELEKNPDRFISWNQGLEKKWTAADAAMETGINMLTRFYYYQLWVSGNLSTEVTQGLADSLRELQSTLSELKDSPVFETINEGPYAGRRYRDVLQMLEQKHVDDFEIATARFAELNQTSERYYRLGAQVLEEISKLEEIADGEVEKQIEISANTETFVNNVLLSSLLVALFVGIGATVLLVRNVNGVLTSLMGILSSSAESLGKTATDIDIHARESAEGAAEQAANLEESSAAMEQIASQATYNADHANSVVSSISRLAELIRRSSANANSSQELSVEAGRSVSQGSEAMRDIVAAMREINESSDQIRSILELIEEITHQTKMLATNAAIEAARAGEQGKGFAVVADEVSKLAENSKNAAQQIAQLVGQSIEKVRKGSALAERGGDCLHTIEEQSNRVGLLIQEIAETSQEQQEMVVQVQRLIEQIREASRQQAQGVEQITDSIRNIDQLTQNSAARAARNAEVTQNLSQKAVNLHHVLAEASQHVKMPHAVHSPSSKALPAPDDSSAWR